MVGLQEQTEKQKKNNLKTKQEMGNTKDNINSLTNLIRFKSSN